MLELLAICCAACCCAIWAPVSVWLMPRDQVMRLSSGGSECREWSVTKDFRRL